LIDYELIIIYQCAPALYKVIQSFFSFSRYHYLAAALCRQRRKNNSQEHFFIGLKASFD